MTKKKIANKAQIKKQVEKIEWEKPIDPEEPLSIPDNNPDIIPEEDPYENPPAYEKPIPGEGP